MKSPPVATLRERGAYFSCGSASISVYKKSVVHPDAARKHEKAWLAIEGYVAQAGKTSG